MPRVDRPLLDELLTIAERPALAWEAFHPGVEIHRLWEDPGGESAALLRYAPGGSVPRHRHEGHEHVFVLRGSQRDEHGLYTAGSHRISPPGTTHAVDSPQGCLVLVVWERPNTIVDG